MYINDLGMREGISSSDALSAQSTAAGTTASNTKAASTKASSTANFPTAIKQAVESQSAAYGEDSELAKKVAEALANLKNDPEWADVGTALSAMYKNQQQMQVQMNLLSAGYSSGLMGLSSSSQYGLGTLAASAYSGMGSLLGSSIFANQLI